MLFAMPRRIIRCVVAALVVGLALVAGAETAVRRAITPPPACLQDETSLLVAGFREGGAGGAVAGHGCHDGRTLNPIAQLTDQDTLSITVSDPAADELRVRGMDVRVREHSRAAIPDWLRVADALAPYTALHPWDFDAHPGPIDLRVREPRMDGSRIDINLDGTGLGANTAVELRAH